MYKNQKILALIPARGGSKGIKNKNIIDLCGKPLISYTIEAALNSKYIDNVIVSTDSSDIANIAVQYGAEVPFLRPQALATDTSKTIDAVLHAITYLKNKNRDYDVLVLLQPTEPLRDCTDIDNALTIFFKNNYNSLVSVSPVTDSPILIRTINNNNELKHLINCNSTIRRQDMKSYYVINGCIYINYISSLSPDTSFNDNSFGFVMDESHSIDIDEYKDLFIAEYYLKNSPSGNQT